MKVAVIGPRPPHRGGIAVHTAGLLRALEGAGHATTSVGFKRLYPRFLFPGSSELLPGACRPADGLDVLRPSTWRQANRRLRALASDLVVVQWWNPAFTPLVRTVTDGIARDRIVLVCHNAEPHERVPASGVLTRLGLAAAGSLLCHSGWVANALLRRCPEARVHTVPMPLLHAPTRDVGQTMRLRDELGLERDQALLLFAGLVRPYKGLDLLLEAWSQVASHCNAKLVLAGESYLGGRSVGRRVADCGVAAHTVVIDRWLAEEAFAALIGAADALVAPYLRASQSALVPVARAAGARVVVSDAGGLHEGLEADGDCRVFPTGRADALGQALRWAAAGAPRHETGRPAPALAADRGWDAVLEALQRISRPTT